MIVQIEEGQLRGTEGKSILTGDTYYAFFGIPYGKPPTGDRRFLAPEPAEPWNGIYDATYERDGCSQINPFFDGGKHTGSEDCLYLNVYIPQKPSNVQSLKPVLFYIHGGGFFMGTGSRQMCSPDYIMEHDVIVVSINYRLHILGFLNLDLPECPGNAGMKDQVLALKWVQKNIKHFGGDAQNVTIIGTSAGGTSVHLHMHSPLSRGLFQKAVSLCGYSYSPWAFTYNPLEAAYQAAQKLGFKGAKDDREGMLHLFKEQQCEKISAISSEFQAIYFSEYCGSVQLTPFKPSVEAIKEDAFLPDYPSELAKNLNSVPVVSGLNDREGLGFVIIFPSAQTESEIVERIESIIKYSFRLDPAKLPVLVNQVKQMYLEENEVKFDGLIDLYTDVICYYFQDAFDSSIKSSSPTYLYNFAYVADSRADLPDFSEKIKPYKGAAHGEESSCLFYALYFFPNGKKFSEADRKVIQTFSTLITNFAKTGNPNSEKLDTIWRPCTVEDQCFLQIGTDLEMIKGPIMGDRLQRLKSIFKSTLKPYNSSDNFN